MSDQEQPERSEPSELQFDQAEYQIPPAPAVTCTVCNHPVPEQYYELNGKIVCDPCRTNLIASLTGGSGIGRFLRAAIYGTAAAAVGCGIYYAVTKATGWHLALISILVGWMVGTAVRKGSRFRGGWIYQAMAIFLTYTAIVGENIPDIVTALADIQKKQDAPGAKPRGLRAKAVAKAAPKAGDGADEKPVGGAAEKADAGKADAGSDEKADAGAPEKPDAGADGKAEAAPGPNQVAAAPDAQGLRNRIDNQPPGLKAVNLALFGFAILLLAYVMPLVAGFPNLLGWVIIFFALQTAWRLNKKPRIKITGPYQVAGLVAEAQDSGSVPIEGAPADA